MANIDSLIPQLLDSPRVLLLGQRALARNDDENPLFQIPSMDLSVRSIHEECLGSRASEVQSQLDALARAIPLDDKLALFRRFPWRCIFTSSIDPIAFRLFHDATKRPVVSVFDSRTPDSANLTLFRLFGATGRQKSGELPPTTAAELRNRRTVMADMLRQVPRAVGPSGRLYVVGWHPGKGDWLRPRDLATCLSELTERQILLFDLDDTDRIAIEEDDDFNQLLFDGKACLYDSSFHDLLGELQLSGRVFVDQALEAPDAVNIAVRKHTPNTLEAASPNDLTQIRISRQEFKRITETFAIPGNLQPPQRPTGTQEEVSQQFLDFLARGPLDNLQHCEWFAFARPMFNEKVIPAVIAKLDTAAPQEHTVVINGQSGSGKSSLIGLLAVALRRSGIPVVIISNKLVPPNRRHLEDFLQIVDSHSSVATAILWDGLEAPDEYHALSKFIASLGKKALVIGTSYEVPQYKPKSANSKTVLIPIDIAVDDSERRKLLAHFNRFLPSCADLLQRSRLSRYGNFFALVYYLTSASRMRLTNGLLAEIESHTQSLDRYLDEQGDTRGTPVSDMAHALRKALGDRYDEMIASESGGTSETSASRTPALRLVESVMLVSSMGLDMPQSLALAVCAEGNVNKCDVYRDAFKKFPVITAYSANGVDHYLKARQALEAEVWCEKVFRSRMNRLAVLLDVAAKLDAREARKQKSPELEFVVKLLQAVGPQGSDQHRISEGYQQIANCVEDIEQRSGGQINPRLLLVKAHCLREFVQEEQKLSYQRTGEFHSAQIETKQLEEWESALERAMSALTSAEQALLLQLEQSASARGTRQMLAVFHTEIAATIGVQLGCLATAIRARGQRSDFTRLGPTIKRAREAWRRAVNSDEENNRAIDTACWIIRDALKFTHVAEEDTYQLLAEWSELIDRYGELDMTPDQIDKYELRESEFASAIGDSRRLDGVVAKSTGRGNYSVHALIARGLAESKGVTSALKYLEDHCGQVLMSESVVLLSYYRLWWKVASGEEAFFPRDELTLGFSPEQWRRLQELAESRLSLEGERDNRLALFHLAWSQLQLGNTQRANDAFHQLETISVGSFRRGRTLALLSGSDAQPVEYTGETRASHFSHVGRVWIEELRIEIPYKVFEFGDPIGAGEHLGPFHVAMNYRGIYAQPVSRYIKNLAKGRGLT